MSLKLNTRTSVCRICLAWDVRAISLSGTPLQAIFEKITNTPLHTPDKRPTAACYFCYQHLRKGYKLMLMSDKAESVLTEIFNRCNKITKQSISLIDRNINSLRDSLMISNVEYYDTIPTKPVDTISIEVKMEVNEDENQTGTNVLHDAVKLEDDGISVDDNWRHDSDFEDGLPLVDLQRNNMKAEEKKPEEKPSELNETSAQARKTKEKRAPKAKLSNRKSGKTRNAPKVDLSNMLPQETPNNSDLKARKHECNICQRRYKKKYLETHILIHAGIKAFGCDFCHSRFRTRGHLDRHLWCMHKVAKEYACKKCGLKFLDLISFKKHFRSHVFECDYCQQQIKDRAEFIIHLKNHSYKFKCDVCEYKITEEDNFEDHMKRFHVGEKIHECEICHIKLPLPKWRAHAKLHKTKHECSVCHKELKKKAFLIEHMRVHTGEKPFECHYCHKSFKTKSSMKIHFKIHTGDRAHKCDFCQKQFITLRELKSHLRLHTGEKPFECSVCFRRFRHKNILNIHSRVHTGEKPYKCRECVQHFADCSARLRHERRFHNTQK